MVKKHKTTKNNPIWMILTFVFAIAFILSAFTNVFDFESNSTPATGFVVKILNDKRCDECSMISEQVETQLLQIFPDMEIQHLDYSTNEGKSLYEDNEVTALPAFLFTESVEKNSNYSNIEQFLNPTGEYLSLRVGASFDPKAEICTNEIDDTGNDLIDCQDPTCAQKLECREEIKNNIKVFTMSDCPYGREAIKALAQVVDSMPGLTYEINYIVTPTSDGEFQSLHGAYEVEEDIRQLCVKELDEENFLPYALCRSTNGVKDVDWKECADELNLDKTEIKSCVEGDLGKELLLENSKIASELGIGASPTWLANNRYQFGGITSAVVQTNICKYNDLEGCDSELSEDAAVPAGQC